MFLGFRSSSPSHIPTTALTLRRFHTSILQFILQNPSKSPLIDEQKPHTKSVENPPKINTFNFWPPIHRSSQEWEKYHSLQFMKNQKERRSFSTMSGGGAVCESIGVKPEEDEKQVQKKERKGSEEELQIEGYSISGVSVAGHQTCVVLPSLNLAFDIGRCPQQAVSQQFLFISHGHMDHIGGLPMYVAARGLMRMKPPTIIVPKVIKESVEKIFEAHLAMGQYGLEHTLVGLDIGEEFFIRKDLKVKAFRTYHRVPSQGYVVYSVKQKLKQEYFQLPETNLTSLKQSGVEITDTFTTPEVAFTGDTTSDFITDADNADALRAKILIVESTYVDDLFTAKDAREKGHTHLSEIISHADRFENKALVLIHFSARYHVDVIENAISRLPPPLAGRVFALTSRFR